MQQRFVLWCCVWAQKGACLSNCRRRLLLLLLLLREKIDGLPIRYSWVLGARHRQRNGRSSAVAVAAIRHVLGQVQRPARRRVW